MDYNSQKGLWWQRLRQGMQRFMENKLLSPLCILAFKTVWLRPSHKDDEKLKALQCYLHVTSTSSRQEDFEWEVSQVQGPPGIHG